MNFLQARLPRPETRRPCLEAPGKGHPRPQRGSLARFRALPVVLALLVLISLACGGSEEEPPEAPVVPEVLQAQRFEVVDAAGVVRAQLSLLEGGRPSLTLMDTAGKPRAWMFLNADGQPRLVLTDTPLFALADAQDELRTVLRLADDGSPIFELNDGTGAARTVMQLLSDGTPVILLTDTEGEILWTPIQELVP